MLFKERPSLTRFVLAPSPGILPRLRSSSTGEPICSVLRTKTSVKIFKPSSGWQPLILRPPATTEQTLSTLQQDCLLVLRKRAALEPPCCLHINGNAQQHVEEGAAETTASRNGGEAVSLAFFKSQCHKCFSKGYLPSSPLYLLLNEASWICCSNLLEPDPHGQLPSITGNLKLLPLGIAKP
ncbi:hypothetical protein ATANTOWER_007461 [Ataeniobius toweri]|uniref:Uncharacterized protein n=1 Tax=Ataeniobius toweri TaxID=208326 RepID=A0ABU7BAE0_9TELE|nr:hypothetical protein [Ataeniobius toweri]